MWKKKPKHLPIKFIVTSHNSASSAHSSAKSLIQGILEPVQNTVLPKKKILLVCQIGGPVKVWNDDAILILNEFNSQAMCLVLCRPRMVM